MVHSNDYTFFLSSWALLKLEKKGILYKTLPILFVITIISPRTDVDYNSVMELSYSTKYLAYINYVLMGYIHFFSMYVFGMYCSANKDIIDQFWNHRKIFWVLMIFASLINIYFSTNFNYSNGTISKIFLTIIVLAYLKHYDNWLISKEKLNKTLDLIAKYSFGIFFIHWYIFFLYNLCFDLPNVMPLSENILWTLCLVTIRFISVSLLSISTLALVKKIIIKIKSEANTRSFIGI